MTPVAALAATRAVAWDAALEETLSGTAPLPAQVHSRYRRVVNLLLPGDRLVALASTELDDAPWTVRVPRWEELGPRIAAGVTLTARTLHLGPGLVVHLDPAQAWSPRPVDLSRVPADDLAAAHSQLLASVPAPTTPFGRAGAALLTEGLDGLRRSLVAGAGAAEVSGAVGRLVGLGEGLTPSGDDALAGLVLVAAQPGTVLGSRLPALRSAVDQHAHRTTLLSATTLRAAAQGRARQSLHDLLAGLVDGTSPAAVGRVLAIGHTSGADLLRGVALALDVEHDLRVGRGHPSPSPSPGRAHGPPTGHESRTSPHDQPDEREEP